jgi:hypothetical protein
MRAKGSTLRSLEREILYQWKRPAGQECALLFHACPPSQAAPTDPPRVGMSHLFLVTTPPPEPQHGCMFPYCGNGIDDLLKISRGKDVPRIMIRQSDVAIMWQQGDSREVNVEAAIQKLTSAKAKPGLVILQAECGDPVDRTLRAITLFGQARIAVVLTMFRHVQDNSCDDPEELRLE